MGRQADWVLPAEAQSVGQARMLVGQTLEDLPEDSVEIALLLTSELVTNAILHASGPVRVVVQRDPAQVRIEVEDSSPASPIKQPMNREATGGRGLLLVEALSHGWGVSTREPGKAVWFRLQTQA